MMQRGSARAQAPVLRADNMQSSQAQKAFDGGLNVFDRGQDCRMQRSAKAWNVNSSVLHIRLEMTTDFMHLGFGAGRERRRCRRVKPRVSARTSVRRLFQEQNESESPVLRSVDKSRDTRNVEPAKRSPFFDADADEELFGMSSLVSRELEDARPQQSASRSCCWLWVPVFWRPLLEM